MKNRAHLLREALVALAGAPSLSARGGHIPRRINSEKMLEGMLVKGKSSFKIKIRVKFMKIRGVFIDFFPLELQVQKKLLRRKETEIEIEVAKNG